MRGTEQQRAVFLHATTLQRRYEKPFPFRRPLAFPLQRRRRRYSGQIRRVVDPERRSDGGETAGDVAVQHGQVFDAEPGHAAHSAEGARTAVHPQRGPEVVRQVRAGTVAGDGVGVAFQAEAVGQADGEGQGQLQEDARVGVRRERGTASQVAHSKERSVTSLESVN